ncbi:MAG TPA: CPBP family intramembrane glutamic endopeptidase, partial [Actinomycetota bacterium]|nr:CPBP family intramembrane glutamic endopeptidase [Actinomycetota bacterium]
ELISRGVILSRLSEAYRPYLAVTLTAAFFGLQHLSAFALTSRDAGDILGNVLLSGIYGFALGAYQLSFRWIWPLIFVHALADSTTTLAAEPLPDLLIGLSHFLLLAFGVVLLRGIHEPPAGGSSERAFRLGSR